MIVTMQASQEASYHVVTDILCNMNMQRKFPDIYIIVIMQKSHSCFVKGFVPKEGSISKLYLISIQAIGCHRAR